MRQQKYNIGDYLIPLSINDIRNYHWDSKNKKYRRIEHFSPQSSADRLRILQILPNNGGFELQLVEEYDDPTEQKEMETEYPDQMVHTIGPQYFTPNGDLTIKNKGNKETKVKWLQNGNPGPYLHGKKSPFYYLDGDLDDPRYRAQVCAGPVNILSYDCLDSITMWVLEPSIKRRKLAIFLMNY